ncbi:hypothetical protein [Flagellimonas sp.]|uniref:hypothetical protein n=1 Tax=Flagellimonas sp. TaxID=2058762 RepID=UPI003B505D82
MILYGLFRTVYSVYPKSLFIDFLVWISEIHQIHPKKISRIDGWWIRINGWDKINYKFLPLAREGGLMHCIKTEGMAYPFRPSDTFPFKGKSYGYFYLETFYLNLMK